ncbi:hypothetical protein BC833DRAFT_584395 [Globomyces pollinis-pini]|nr:hypothetical protein BC833DRAFT_584395 [Globomyces pollinis-pini]
MATRFRQNWLNYIQVVASTFQFLNQLWFFLLLNLDADSVFGNRCRLFQDIDFVCYFIFQMCSSGVLIFRTTILLPPNSQIPFRASMTIILLIAGFFSIVSSYFRTVSIENNRCISIWHQPSNQMLILTLLFLYLILFTIFCIPAIKYYREMKSSNTKQRLTTILYSITFRVLIALAGYLFSVIVSFTGMGVWNGNYIIQFTFENYCNITASTYVNYGIDESKKDPNELPTAFATTKGNDSSHVQISHYFN